jgi:hypothetical protein
MTRKNSNFVLSFEHFCIRGEKIDLSLVLPEALNSIFISIDSRAENLWEMVCPVTKMSKLRMCAALG